MATTPNPHPEPYIIAPTSTHTSTIILLHGTSQTGPSFAASFLTVPFSPPSPSVPVPQHTTLPTALPHTKLLFPTGASKPLTVFAGAPSHAWLDIHTFADRTIGEAASIPGLRESILYLEHLIEQEAALLAGRGEVVVLGFSQGCALGVMTFLSGELDGRGVGAFVGCSGWCPFRAQIEEVVRAGGGRGEVRAYVRELLGLEPLGEHESGPPRGPKIFLTHGERDEKMKFHWGQEMRHVLVGLGFDVHWKSYPELAHSWCEEEMSDLVAFLGEVCGGEVVEEN